MEAGFGPMVAGIYVVPRGQQERRGDMLLSIFCSNNIIAPLRYLPGGELCLELIYQRADPFRKLLAGGVDRPYAEVAHACWQQARQGTRLASSTVLRWTSTTLFPVSGKPPLHGVT